MALSKEVYRALEDIVGPENITEELAIMDSYAFNFPAEIRTPNYSRFYIRPAAVVLPQNTEEVQAIVKICNRYRIKFKAFSTGWGLNGVPSEEGVIQLDLRRMDRILEIDEKNMYAVVEPYVMNGILQAEVMKLGLNCNVPGSGAAVSPLANALAGDGHGPGSIYHGHNSEVVLALEWVMPNGDILRTGSLGSGLGWFCGEGPGPSLRGIVRGSSGARGCIGVYTKVALKLSSWPGPPTLPVEGTVPAYHLVLPDNFRAYNLAFPSWQAFFEAAYKIYDAEIGYLVHRQWQKLGQDLAPAFIKMYNDPTKSLDDMEEMLEDPEIQRFTKEMRMPLPIVLAGQTPNDIEYQEKVLEEILAETGGHKVAGMSGSDMEGFTMLYLLRLGHKNLNFVYAGGYFGSWHQYGTPDFNIRYALLAEEVMRKHQAKGLIVQSGGDALMGPLARMGGGGTTSLEQFVAWDVCNKESIEGAWAYFVDAAAVAKEHGIPPGFDAMMASQRMTREQRQARLAGQPDTRRLQWQWKIKQMLDPNDTGELEGYQMVKPLK